MAFWIKDEKTTTIERVFKHSSGGSLCMLPDPHTDLQHHEVVIVALDV